MFAFAWDLSILPLWDPPRAIKNILLVYNQAFLYIHDCHPVHYNEYVSLFASFPSAQLHHEGQESGGCSGLPLGWGSCLHHSYNTTSLPISFGSPRIRCCAGKTLFFNEEDLIFYTFDPNPSPLLLPWPQNANRPKPNILSFSHT